MLKDLLKKILVMLCVIDTVAFINYFREYINNEPIRISRSTSAIISKSLSSEHVNYKLCVPSVVFIEVFDKFLKTEEQSLKFYYNVFVRLKSNPKVEIKGIELGVLAQFFSITYDLEQHDKIIYSSAREIDATLITNDPKIIACNNICGNPIDIIF